MDETAIDLKVIIKTIKKRSRLILSVFVSFVIATLLITLLISPTYEAESTIRVKQPKGLGDSIFANMPGSNFNAKQLMSTYAEIIKSRTVVQRVIDETQSDKKKVPTYEAFVKTITTQPVKDTEILKIKVKAKSAVEAQLVANTLVNDFLDRMTFLVRAEQGTVKEFIGQRLQESQQELERSEAALEKYKSEHKVMDPEAETKALLDKLKDVDKLKAENSVALSGAQAKLSTAHSQIGEEKPGFIADSPLIQQYKGKLSELEVQLVSLTQKYTDRHPEIMATRAGIAEVQAALNAEIGKVVTANAPSMNPIHQGLLQAKIQAEAEIAARAAQKAAIDRVVGEGETSLNKLPSKEHGLARVLRDAKVNQDIYVMLAKRYEETRISEVMQPTDVQVIDVAVAPEKPILPKKALNVVIGAILGLFVGIGLAFLLEYLNKSINNAQDVKDYLGLPVLGSIPDFNSKTEPKQGFFTKFKNLLAPKRMRNDNLHH